MLASLGTALLQARSAVAVIAALGRLLLRPLFRLAATARSNELFIAPRCSSSSPPAGRRLGRPLHGARRLRRRIAPGRDRIHKAIKDIEPVKGLLLGVFFFSVGMSIDLREVVHEPVWLAGGVVAIIAVKGVLILGLGRLFGLPRPAAVETGLLLGPRRRVRLCRHRRRGRAGLVEGGARALRPGRRPRSPWC